MLTQAQCIYTVKVLIKVQCRYKVIMTLKGALFGVKNHFGHLGVPCLERCLQIRAQVTLFVKFEYGYTDNGRTGVCYEAIMNTSVFGVQRSMKGSATVKEVVVSKVA